MYGFLLRLSVSINRCNVQDDYKNSPFFLPRNSCWELMFSIAHCQVPLPPLAHMLAASPYRSSTDSSSSSPPRAVISNVRYMPRPSTTTSPFNGDDLPPYSLDTELPRYKRVPEAIFILPEPSTLAMYLFIGGFRTFLCVTSNRA